MELEESHNNEQNEGVKQNKDTIIDNILTEAQALNDDMKNAIRTS
jgi:hypothetical protein